MNMGGVLLKLYHVPKIFKSRRTCKLSSEFVSFLPPHFISLRAYCRTTYCNLVVFCVDYRFVKDCSKDLLNFKSCGSSIVNLPLCGYKTKTVPIEYKSLRSSIVNSLLCWCKP